MSRFLGLSNSLVPATAPFAKAEMRYLPCTTRSYVTKICSSMYYLSFCALLSLTSFAVLMRGIPFYPQAHHSFDLGTVSGKRWMSGRKARSRADISRKKTPRAVMQPMKSKTFPGMHSHLQPEKTYLTIYPHKHPYSKLQP